MIDVHDEIISRFLGRPIEGVEPEPQQPVQIDGQSLRVRFERFDLEAYELFLRCKGLPESELSYDWQSDSYTLTAPARFAGLLGVQQPTVEREALPMASHLFDFQAFCVERALEVERFALWCDCVAGETIIEGPDGAERIDVLAERGEPIRVWTLAPDGSTVAAWGSAPFQKGRADMYEFTLDDGTAIKVTEGHRFLTPEGWALAGALSVGALLAVAVPSQRQTTAGYVPSELRQDARRLMRRAGDSMGHCSTRRRQCDLRPHLAGDSGREPVPSLIDAPELGHWNRHEDDLAHKRASNPFRPSSAHPSMRDCVHRGCCASDVVGYHAAPLRSIPSASRTRAPWQSAQYANPAPSMPVSGQYEGQVLMGGSVLQVDPDGGVASHIPFRSIVCIQFIRNDFYYDLHVPGYENYLANGVWNHNTGLGKSHMILEWSRQVVHRTGGRVLIFEPLSVIEQMRALSREYFGIEVERLETREALAAWCKGEGTGIGITNPQKLIDGVMPELRYLAGVAFDESSLLKTGGGVIKWNAIKSCRGIKYKLSATATPAPNDAMEYASQASFLEKMRSEGDIIWTYFQKTGKDGEWAIKPHAKAAFYSFMSSWSIYMRDPSHFGFGDILSSLPDPDIREYQVPITDEQRRLLVEYQARSGKGMFSDRMGVQERSKLSQLAKGFLYQQDGGKRRARSVESEKPAFVAQLVRSDMAEGRQVLVWTVFDEEGEIIARELGGGQVAVLSGKQTEQERLEQLEAFRDGRIRVLISKASLIGYGLNLQFCTSMVFSGFDDSFERLYQAVRRCLRFGQTEVVRVHVPYVPELEGMIFTNIREKERRFMEDVAIQEQNYREAMGL